MAHAVGVLLEGFFFAGSPSFSSFSFSASRGSYFLQLIDLVVKARNLNSRFHSGRGSRIFLATEFEGHWGLTIIWQRNLSLVKIDSFSIMHICCLIKERPPSPAGVNIWKCEGNRGPSCHMFLMAWDILTGILQSIAWLTKWMFYPWVSEPRVLNFFPHSQWVSHLDKDPRATISPSLCVPLWPWANASASPSVKGMWLCCVLHSRAVGKMNVNVSLKSSEFPWGGCCVITRCYYHYSC